MRLPLVLLTLFAILASGQMVGPTAEAQEKLSPQWLREGFTMRVSHRRDNGEMMQMVRPILGAVNESVVQVLSGGQPVALGTVVGADGYVLTKRSELSADPIRVRLFDNRVVPARVAAVRRANDLALLKIEANILLKPARFDAEVPGVGGFAISAGRTGRPIGIGSIGVLPRRVDHQGGLGVVLRQGRDGRARVDRVWQDSGAAEAGIEPEDRIIAINGHEVFSSNSVIETLSGIFPGESVQLTILRSGSTLDVHAGIRDLGILQETENDSRVNGPRSVRLSGFERVFQHDTVLAPDQCGGPVLDSSGRVIGLNIARAGRVVSYAVPSSLVRPETNSMLAEARAAAN
ncbi:serine endoprotease [Novipirellula artificiosorum]|uniref:Serine endoprotease n=2 Tax=Novipirellula artificiosorum TaxID=2528016 RepID=A0A5C6DTT5_9BACT|nr:serine endoprotease [Novipirellula artificiosorum]